MGITRRGFIETTAAAGAGFLTTPVLGQQGIKSCALKDPAKPLQVAFLGLGRMGDILMSSVAWTKLAKIVALVDPDPAMRSAAKRKLASMQKLGIDTNNIAEFDDYREFYKQTADGVDAVFIATPNHHRLMPSLLAFRNGIHAYIEKPLAYTVEEGRRMLAEAQKHHAVTQMGQWGHSQEAVRRLVEYIRAGALGQVTVHWYDGLKGDTPWDETTWFDGNSTSKLIKDRKVWFTPPLLEEIERKYNVNLGDDGSIFVGEKGYIVMGGFGDWIRFFPGELNKPSPEKTIPRVKGGHQVDFLRGCMGGPTPCANLEYSQRLNEVVMLGVTAIAEDSGDELTWDAKAGRFTNKESANQFLKRTYRKGWEI